MCFQRIPLLIARAGVYMRARGCGVEGAICLHIGVGFEVVYLSELGKFDGLKSEIGNW